MKKRVVSLVLTLLVLLSLCGVVNVAGAASQAPPARPNEMINSNEARTGSIPTKIVLLAPSTTDITAHIGDRVPIHLKLVQSDTGAGIPNATIGISGSLDGKSWYSVAGLLVTDSNGEIVSITVIIPDPRPIPVVGGFIHLPMTGYIKVTYAGDGTYMGCETPIIKATLAP
jgi:hypothetical protein